MENENYQAKAWEYHYPKKPKGKPLMLLDIEELVMSKRLLFKNLSYGAFLENKTNYSYLAIHENEYRDKSFFSIKSSIRNVIRGHKTESYAHLLDAINEDLNKIFSDEGWRKIRLEISQIKKRNKKKRIELSENTLKRLVDFKAENKLDTYEDVIELLFEREELYWEMKNEE